MRILNDEELEKLTSPSLKRWVFRSFYLIFGSILILLGILFTTSQFDFGIRVNGINLSLMIYISLLVIGLIITWKFFFTPYYLRRNSTINADLGNFKESLNNYVKVNSFSISRLIAALLFILVGIISLLIPVLEIGDQLSYGGLFTLGENTFFYVIGLPAFGIGFSLLIYLIMSPFKGIFTQSQSSFFIFEFRPVFPWLTEISKNEIQTIKYQNNYLGRKLAWILLLVPIIGFQLITAISIFLAPNSILEIQFSWILILCSIIEFIGLILLLFFTQDFFGVITSDLLYYMWISPIKTKKRSQFNSIFSKFLNFESENKDGNNNLFSEISKRHFQLFGLIFGMFLIIGAFLINTELFLIGPLTSWLVILYGVILVVKALSYNFSNQGGDSFYYDNKNKIFKFKREFKTRFNYINHYNVESVSVKKKFRKLEHIEMALLGWVLILTVSYQVESWLVLDTVIFLLNNLISTFFVVILLIFIFLYICLPIDQIEIKTLHNVYQIEVTTRLERKNIFTKYFCNLKEFPKQILKKELKKFFIQRIGLIIFLILISAFSTYFMLTTYLL